MHSLRRVAVRAACSSSKALAVPRQQVASFAVQTSKVNARPAAMLPLARYFSQTSQAAEDEKAAVEEAFGSVEQTTTSPSRSSAGAENIVHISNMNYEVTSTHIEEAFGKFGQIDSIRIVLDENKRSRGYAFVTFATVDSAKLAIQEADRSFWHGRRINVSPRIVKESNNSAAAARRPKEPTDSIYIGNIPYETSDADLNRLFNSLENVTDVRIAVDRNTGWPRGFAHADFKDIESSIKAFEKLKTHVIDGRLLRLDYASPVAARQVQRANRDSPLQQSDTKLDSLEEHRD
ncbi:RNA-binding domain-containing protein [Hypoxylon sp. NC1633]|nr:RNA-binding domain-containing protein [Hypoxylon sp. NC1633]